MAADVQQPVSNETEDLTASMWRDDEWLKFYPLNAHTAIDYFSLSPFYTMDCNNEKAKLKGMPTSAIPQLWPGTEFVLQEAGGPLFVVRRQHRSSADTAKTHAIYYILEGSVYQAPTIHAAVAARLARCLHAMQTAFCRMQDDLDPALVGERITQQQDQQEKDSTAAAEIAVAAEAAAAAQVKQPTVEERSRRDAVNTIIASALHKHGNVRPAAVTAALSAPPSRSPSVLPASAAASPAASGAPHT